MNDYVRPETLNLLEENTGGKFLGIGLGSGVTSKARAKAKINKWDYINLKSSAQQWKPLTKLKGTIVNESICRLCIL